MSSSGNYILQLDPEQIENMWPTLKPRLKQAEKRCYVTLDTLYDMLLKNLMQCWIIVTADAQELLSVWLTQLKADDNGDNRHCLVFYIEGESLADWVGHVEALEQWARDERCLWIEFTGRKGFKPFLKPFGYHDEAIVYRKVLKDGH